MTPAALAVVPACPAPTLGGTVRDGFKPNGGAEGAVESPSVSYTSGSCVNARPHPEQWVSRCTR